MAQARKTSSAKKTSSAAKPKTTKSTKTTKTTTTAKSTKATTSNTGSKTCKIILGIMIGILALACIIFAICKIATSNNSSSSNNLTLENGKGEKISAVYAALDGYGYKALVPASFKVLDDATIKEIYGEDDAPTLVYSNDKHTVNVAFSKPEIELSNDDMPDYLNAMKRIFDLSADVLNTELYNIDDYNIANLEMITDYTNEKLYNNMAFFSYDGKLAIIAFNCREDESNEWKKVGQEIIKSIEFTE